MVIGIEYNQQDGNLGFFELRRRASLRDIALEIRDILTNGKSSMPAFPPEAGPEILYAWDLDFREDGDIYPELMSEIQRHMKTKAA